MHCMERPTRPVKVTFCLSVFIVNYIEHPECAVCNGVQSEYDNKDQLKSKENLLLHWHVH